MCLEHAQHGKQRSQAHATRDTPGERPAADQRPGTPRWVKATGIIALVVVVLIAIAMLTGGAGQHGPGRHTGSDGADRQTPTANVTRSDSAAGLTPPGAKGSAGHAPPAGVHTP